MKSISKRLLCIFLAAVMLLSFCACGNGNSNDVPANNSSEDHTPKLVKSMELLYATGFSVDYYEDGYKLITVKEGPDIYLVIPEGADSKTTDKLVKSLGVKVIKLYQPLTNIYLAATATMCLFDKMGALDNVTMSSLKADDWYIQGAVDAMNAGKMVYAGKYSAPDFELILSKGCKLALESMMIYHTPEIKEKLETLGIPVFVEKSTYESHPLGRTEWIKLYAAMLNMEDAAEAAFAEQVGYLKEAEGKDPTGKTVAFFYINSSGNAVARKSGDYVCGMIELAGGKYIFDDLGKDSDNNLSTVNLDMETFYATAKDADFIFYNSTIMGEISSVDNLKSLSALIKDFKAVKENNVWCTGENLYQETTDLGQMILEFNKILSGDYTDESQFTYMKKIN
ncbi:MAG: ABC transporter substrate-binding protein [Firmicutes bacterium]|nr:ABC transporter substrate-binding protein [Bacillota bacterium]